MGAIFMWAMMYWVDRIADVSSPCWSRSRPHSWCGWELGWIARVGVAALVVRAGRVGTGLYFSGVDRMKARFTC